MAKNRLVNGVVYNGQDPKRGITYTLTGDPLPDVGDVVSPGATAGTVQRAPDETPFEGVLVTKDADDKGSVQRGEVVTVKRTGAISLGLQSLAGDGQGGVKAHASSTMCRVIDTFSEGDDDYVTLYIL